MLNFASDITASRQAAPVFLSKVGTSRENTPLKRMKDKVSTYLNNPSGGKTDVGILVVDADSSVGDMIRDNFKDEGFRVDCCATGDDTFNFDLSQYKLLLLDLSTDENNGLSLIEQIKQIYSPEELAIIVYSVRMLPETIIRALNVGADDYLIKPFSIRELRARVRSVLRRR